MDSSETHGATVQPGLEPMRRVLLMPLALKAHRLRDRSECIATLVMAALVALALTPARISAQRRTAAEAEKAGWTAIRAGRAADAASAFSEAMQLAPKRPEPRLGAGLAAYLLGRVDEATQHLTGALQLEPALTEASLLLGQILYRKGDLDGAIQVYEQALAHSPGDQTLTAKLETWRREAELHGRFAQRLGDHFTVLFEGPAEETIAARTVELLEAAYWRIGTALGAYPSEPITVVLYTQQQFTDITRSPSWAAGAFDGRIRVPIRGALQNPRELDRILSHEFTHALVFSITPRGVPHWLDEGLALTFEPAGARGSARPGVNSLPADAVVPLERLEVSFEGLSSEQARAAYIESSAAVQALIDLSGMPAILNLLQNLASGLRFDEAFERATQISYAEFRAQWNRSER